MAYPQLPKLTGPMMGVEKHDWPNDDCHIYICICIYIKHIINIIHWSFSVECIKWDEEIQPDL